jgi:NAD(P)-dependent dehydrogenase (short-subunit alcohol dehydrogenase family)
MNIENATVLITGANRGIGKAYAEEFAKSGAKKIYLGVRDPASVKDLVASNPGKFTALKLDVTSAADIKAAAQTAKDVTILINNAGALESGPLISPDTLDGARKEMEVNYFGPLALIRAFAPILKANGGGAIATVSSIVGHVVFPDIITYSASKFAAHALIQGARLELTSQGTLVVGVYPGPIDTDMAKDIQMDKFPPSQVAQKTIEALKSGQEDVFPDAMAEQVYAAYRNDPKAFENSTREGYEQAAKAA